MTNLTIAEQIAQMSKSDVSLSSISWIENGRDVVSSLRLICRWTQGFRIALEFDVHTGTYPLSWDAEFKR